MLFSSTRKPNLKKYLSMTDSAHLTDSSCYIHGPFSFDSRSDIISAKQCITLSHWKFLLTLCNTLGIVSSIIVTLTNTIPNKIKKLIT